MPVAVVVSSVMTDDSNNSVLDCSFTSSLRTRDEESKEVEQPTIMSPLPMSSSMTIRSLSPSDKMLHKLKKENERIKARKKKIPTPTPPTPNTVTYRTTGTPPKRRSGGSGSGLGLTSRHYHNQQQNHAAAKAAKALLLLSPPPPLTPTTPTSTTIDTALHESSLFLSPLSLSSDAHNNNNSSSSFNNSGIRSIYSDDCRHLYKNDWAATSVTDEMTLDSDANKSTTTVNSIPNRLTLIEKQVGLCSSKTTTKASTSGGGGATTTSAEGGSTVSLLTRLGRLEEAILGEENETQGQSLKKRLVILERHIF